MSLALPLAPPLSARPAALCLAGLLAFAAVAVAAPLAAYTVTLAAFGLPHVLSELRYVDRRFGRRIARNILTAMALLLPIIVAIRSCVVFHVVPAEWGVPAELTGVVVLALACARGPLRQRVAALAAAVTLGTAALVSPFVTAAGLSILHNLTPLGFLWQLAPRALRPRVMMPALAAFLGLPLLVATGLPRMMLAAFIGAGGNLDPLHAGPVATHFYVYVPAPFVATPAAIDLFTASVVAQGAHYAAVIIILPLLLSRFDLRARGLAAWPRGIAFAAICAGAGLIGLIGAQGGFAEARALYGIFASVHAWIEIPVLIVALTGADQPCSSNPDRNEAELLNSDTSMARSTRSAAIQAISRPSASTTAASSAATDGQ